ncbi:transposase [Spirillospora sp. NPDC049024]
MEAAAHRRDPLVGANGAPWRDVPDYYGCWQAVYGQFRRWQRDDTWARILAGLQTRADAAGLIGWEVSVDSTIVRDHQHASRTWQRGYPQWETTRRRGHRAC